MAVPAFESGDQMISRSLAARRLQMTLALLFAATTLMLTALGVYSTLTHATKRRVHDIAVRMALGAPPAAIRRMVLGQTVGPVAMGIASGCVLALGITPLLRGLLFGVSPGEPRVFALTGLVLGIVCVAAGLLPGLQASRIDPIVAIRSE